MPRRLLATLVGLALSAQGTAFATEKTADKPKDTTDVLQFKAKSLDGKEVDFGKYQGKVLLIVNTASKCGCTPQYKDLEALHEKYAKDGLAVIAFPCNQFGHQEPGDAKQISDFCTSKFNVQFDIFEKIDVNGKNAAPIYKWLTSEAATPADPGKVRWNFEKFVIGRNGKVVARFRSLTNPRDPKVVAAIEGALKK